MGRLRFIIIAFLLIGILVLIELFYPKPVSWHVSLSSDDPAPFGLAALRTSLPDLFKDSGITITRESFYLMQDSLESRESRNLGEGYLVISQIFNQGFEDLNAMLSKIENGANMVIASYQFGDPLLDTMGISITDEITKGLYPSGLIPQEDSAYLEITRNELDEKLIHRRMDAPYNFEIEDNESWKILMINEEDKPVTIARKWGEGNIILSCTPLIFSNYYLLYTNNSMAVEALLSYLPAESLHWTEFYSRGRGEPATPLRYILNTEPLKWAYYIIISTILIFVFFEAKRKQRPIPIIEFPRNDSMDFVKTVGNLYYEKGDHKNIAEKKILYLLEFIRNNYNLSTLRISDPDFQEQLSHKSGKPLLNIEGLFTMIEILQRKESIHEEELRVLNDKIEAFLKP